MSKLTLHFQQIPGYASGFVAESGVEYVKLIDPPGDDPFPGVKSIGRTYMPDNEANALVALGAAGGEEWFTRWLPIYESRPYVFAWESPNEPHPMWDHSFRLALNDFLVVWSGLMGDRGWKTVGGCFSVGWPDISTAQDMGLGLEMCDYLGVHEYSAPTMDSLYPWHCVRYRNTIAELRNAGYEARPVFITECGIDGGVSPVYRPRTGWKSFATEQEYIEQLAWYDRELMADSYVEAATIFVSGPHVEWLDFEVTESLADKLSDYIIENPTPGPIDPEERALGIDVCEYQGDINWELVKADGYNFVIIRASGPNADRTAVVADPRFASYYEGAGSVGMLRGAYHGLQVGFDGQAKLFVDTVGDRLLELGYYSDLELRGLTDEKCNVHLLAVDNRISERKGIPAGRHTGVYTNPSFMVGRETYWAEDRVLWLAHWTSEENIIVPGPWDTWEFWQYNVGDVGHVDGINARIDLDAYNGTTKELYDKYKPNNGEGEMVEVVDLQGVPIENGWADAVARGARVINASPPEGATVWRVKKLILDTGGSMAFRTYAVDENDVPLPQIAILEGWVDGRVLPDDAAPRLSESAWGQPEGLPNRADVLGDQLTGVDGFLEWTWGGGEFLDPANPAHWAWVMPGDFQWYSDVMFVPGWWDEHIKYWVVFSKGEGSENGGNGGDGDLAEVVVQLKRIADSTECMVAHWPFK